MSSQETAQTPESPADIPKAYNHYGGSFQTGHFSFILPLVLELVLMIQVQLLLEGQEEGQHMFRKGLAVGSRAVGQLHLRSQDPRPAVSIGSGRIQLEPF